MCTAAKRRQHVAVGVIPRSRMPERTKAAKRRQQLSMMFPLKQPFALERNVVSFQERNVFFFKRAGPVVVFLFPNVLFYQFDMRIADRECAVSLLPLEPVEQIKSFVDPFR
jgi:hypothetical protein